MNSKIFNPRSKTHWVATATSITGGLLTFAPQAMQFIPTEYYGPIFIALGVTFQVLRNVTTTPIDQR